MLKAHFHSEPKLTTNIPTPLSGIQSFTESDSPPILMLVTSGAFIPCMIILTPFATALKEFLTPSVLYNSKSEGNFITGFYTDLTFTNQTFGSIRA